MVSIRSRNAWGRLLIAAVGVSLAACSSSSSGGESGGKPPASLDEFTKAFKYNDGELTGWKQKEGDATLSSYVANDLYKKIDGPADGYKANGCQYALYQDLVAPDEQYCTLVLMDFGTPDKAQSEVDEKNGTVAPDTTIPGYDEKSVIGATNLTGLTIYGRLDWLYFEIELDGYVNKQDQAVQDGTEFLKLLQKKLK